MTNRFSTKRGDDLVLSFTWKQNNVVVDLTGCTAEMHIARHGRDAEVELTSADGDIVITGASGLVVATASAADMDIAPDTYQTDLQLTFPDGTVKSSQTLTIVVEADITRS